MSADRPTLQRFVQADWLYSSGIIALILLTYAPVLWGNYAFLDDYVFLRAAQQGSWSGFVPVLGAGRPVAAVLLSWGFSMGPSIDHLWILRAFTIGGLGLAAVCTFRAFCLAGHPQFLSAAIGTTMFLLPSFQVYASWAQYFVTGPTICLAYLAFSCAFKARSVFIIRDKLLRTAAAILLLGISAAIYQPLAMCYWLYLAIALTGPGIDQRALKQKLPFLASVGAAGAASGYLIFRVCQMFYPSTNARFSLTTQFQAKLSWFFSEALRRVAGLNLLNSGGAVSLLLGATVVIGVWFYCQNVLKAGRQTLLFLGCCVLLASAPNLLTGENWASSRSLGGLTMIWTLFGFLAVCGFTHLRPADARPLAAGIMSFWLLTSAVLASRNTTELFVLPQERELSFIKAGLAAPEFTPGKRLVFVGGHWSILASPLVLYDEFGLASTAVSYTLRPMLELLLPKVRPDISTAAIRIVDFGAAINAAPDEYVLDMKGLQALK